MAAALEVLAAGPLTLIQDLGRPGLAAVGVGRSGAADRTAFRLGARLLAQDYAAAALEVTLGGLEVRAHGNVMIALTGAEAPTSVDGYDVGYRCPVQLRDAQTLRLQTPHVGLRTYLSVRGGIEVPAVLGSRATDTLAGLGPAPVKQGDVLRIGKPPRDFPCVDVAPARAPTAGVLVLRATPGPRSNWLVDLEALVTTSWTVSGRSNRVGVRLDGSPLRYSSAHRGQELPSEGVVRGAVQVPPGGQPVLFLADHPVTGGYPVVAVVVGSDVDRAAQARPGQELRLVLRPSAGDTASHREGRAGA